MRTAILSDFQRRVKLPKSDLDRLFRSHLLQTSRKVARFYERVLKDLFGSVILKEQQVSIVWDVKKETPVEDIGKFTVQCGNEVTAGAVKLVGSNPAKSKGYGT